MTEEAIFSGQEPIKVKMVKPPAKVQIPQEETEEDEEETEGRYGGLRLPWFP